jgi:amino acid transporter
MTATVVSHRDWPGVPSVILTILPAVAPLVILAAVIPLTYATTGSTALPLAFAGLGIVLMLFSVGFLAMSRHIPNTGSLYAYVAQGLGRPLGLGAAWLALIAYSALQISLYGLVGAAANVFLGRTFGVQVAWWVAALIALVLVIGSGLISSRVRGRLLALLVCLELVTVLGFAVVAGRELGPNGLSVALVDPDLMLAVGFGAALVPALFAFAGFETATVFAETSRGRRRAVATGTYLSVVLVAVVGGVATWSLDAASGGAAVITESAATDVPALPFRLADATLPAAAVTAAAALLLISVLVALMAWQVVVARYVYALRRERIRPGTFASLGRAGGGRRAGILFLGVVALAGIGLGAWRHIDPVLYFFRIGMAGSYGLLILLLLTSLAVVTYFGRDARGENVARRMMAPALATALLGAVAVMAGREFGLLVGLNDRWSWLVPAGAGCVVVLGMLWALVERIQRPHRYWAIGLGPNSLTGVAVQDRVTPPPYLAAHTLAQTSRAPTAGAPTTRRAGRSPSGSDTSALTRPWGY